MSVIKKCLVCRAMGFRPSPEELAELIEEIDEDGSGAIEFPEFAQEPFSHMLFAINAGLCKDLGKKVLADFYSCMLHDKKTTFLMILFSFVDGFDIL
jgi:hypothetical protein